MCTWYSNGNNFKSNKKCILSCLYLCCCSITDAQSDSIVMNTCNRYRLPGQIGLHCIEAFLKLSRKLKLTAIFYCYDKERIVLILWWKLRRAGSCFCFVSSKSLFEFVARFYVTRYRCYAYFLRPVTRETKIHKSKIPSIWAPINFHFDKPLSLFMAKQTFVIYEVFSYFAALLAIKHNPHSTWDTQLCVYVFTF